MKWNSTCIWKHKYDNSNKCLYEPIEMKEKTTFICTNIKNEWKWFQYHVCTIHVSMKAIFALNELCQFLFTQTNNID